MEYIEYLETMRKISPLFVEIEKRAADFGYMLAQAHRDGYSLVVDFMYPAERFQPQIIFDGWKTKKFGLVTSGYGSLFGDQLDTFMQKYANAMLFVRWLNSLDLTQLPEIKTYN